MWTMGWGPDYGDAHTFASVLACGETNSFARTCNEIDSTIIKASLSTDLVMRDAYYARIEEAFFGREGEFPMIPLFMRTDFFVVQNWYEGPHETDGMYSGTHFDYYTIDARFCSVSAAGSAVYMRRSPDTTSELAGTLEPGESMIAVGQATSDDGFIWWQLENEAWVRSDTVVTSGYCEGLPIIPIPDL